MGLIKTAQPALHGDQHLPYGSDPIPGLMVEPPGSFSDWVLTLTGVWAYWPLQEASGDAIDQGPTGADLQPIGSPAYHATGPNTDDLPYAVRLTGSAQNTISDDSFYNTADDLGMNSYSQLTAMCWIKPDSASTIGWPLPILGTWDVFKTGWVLYLLQSTRQLTWASGNGSSTDNLVGPPVTMDAWSLVAVTRDASHTVKLYVNGSEVDSASGLGLLTGSGHGIRLGAVDFATTDPDSYHFYGNMAGAVFVDHALTGGEILDGYNAATGGTAGTGVASVTAGDSSITIAGTAADPTVAVATGGIGPSQLASTTVTTGSYGDATHIPTFTVDADGRLTAASSVTFTAGTSSADTAGWMPLTTVLGGTPDLVWDSTDSLIPTYGPF